MKEFERFLTSSATNHIIFISLTRGGITRIEIWGTQVNRTNTEEPPLTPLRPRPQQHGQAPPRQRPAASHPPRHPSSPTAATPRPPPTGP